MCVYVCVVCVECLSACSVFFAVVKLSECQTRPAGFHKLLYRLTQIEAK